MKQAPHLFSQAEKCAFFEKIFREHKIVPVDSHHVEEVKLDSRWWYRRNLAPVFSTLKCTAYKFGNYVIVWKSCSNEPILLLEKEQPFEIFSTGDYNFLLRKKLSDTDFCFERYTWKPSQKAYISEQYTPNTVPADFPPKEEKIIRSKRDWLRMYPHEDIETKSVDNTIFYEYIVKFWQI